MGLGGGGDIVKSNSLGATATMIQKGPVCVTAVKAINTTGADAYIQLFDAAAAANVTVGTTVPDWVVLSDFGAGLTSLGDGLPSDGLLFKLGVVAASCTTPTGNTAATQHLRVVIR